MTTTPPAALPAFREYLGLLGVLAALLVLFSATNEHFLSAANLRTILNQTPDALIIAVGMTLVLVAGGIDLSVGSVLALSEAVLGLALLRAGLPLPAAMAAALAAGLGAGLLNGLIIARWRLPAFIVTLGMLEAARGGAYLVTRSQTQYLGAKIEMLAAPVLFGISGAVFAAIAVVVLGQGLLSLTVYGRHLAATGANEESARLSGVPVCRVRTAVYAISGLLAGAAAIIHCARLGAADPNAGAGYELSAIAAVVIGGASLMGGRGSVINTLLGVLIIAVLENGLAQAGAQEPAKRLVTGAVIVAAVIVDHFRHRRGAA